MDRIKILHNFSHLLNMAVPLQTQGTAFKLGAPVTNPRPKKGASTGPKADGGDPPSLKSSDTHLAAEPVREFQHEDVVCLGAEQSVERAAEAEVAGLLEVVACLSPDEEERRAGAELPA